MPKFKERKKVVKFPVFLNYKIVTILTTDKKKTVNKISNKHKIILDSDDFGALHVWVGGGVNTSYLIFSPDLTDVSTVTHECWHCIRRFMMHFAGAEMDNEIVAYHLGYLSQIVYDFINS